MADEIKVEPSELVIDSNVPWVSKITQAVYELLAREDLPKKSDPNVAHGMPYITGETVITMLNKILGSTSWNFIVLEEWIDKESDEVVVHGRLTAQIPIGPQRADGTYATIEVTHEQFGSQKIKRLRSSGAPSDMGFDYKGAGTDCMKKCATQIGVGLYLARKEELAFDASKVITETEVKPPTRRTPAKKVENVAWEYFQKLKAEAIKQGLGLSKAQADLTPNSRQDAIKAECMILRGALGIGNAAT